MASERAAFTLLTLVVVAGTVVLLAGVAFFGSTNMVLVGAGGTVMVAGILAMAGYISMLDEPEYAEAEAGH